LEQQLAKNVPVRDRRRSRLGTIMEKEESHEWDEHAWFGLGATSRHGPAPAERGPPASPLCGTMARAGRARLCPAAAGRRAHESRWDGALGGFTTHPLKDGAGLSLQITDLTLAFHVAAGT